MHIRGSIRWLHLTYAASRNTCNRGDDVSGMVYCNASFRNYIIFRKQEIRYCKHCDNATVYQCFPHILPAKLFQRNTSDRQPRDKSDVLQRSPLQTLQA